MNANGAGSLQGTGVVLALAHARLVLLQRRSRVVEAPLYAVNRLLWPGEFEEYAPFGSRDDRAKEFVVLFLALSLLLHHWTATHPEVCPGKLQLGYLQTIDFALPAARRAGVLELADPP